ncbi:ACP S-malonyltransferase [Geitlerinema sp. PCC 9228]|jgi:[acyl-carrier-protein] S-malonyltransferase|uniref:ACP S-malonyltransferase n=1 Tax=Geitlerinema sp. PCC 9228 TaxID=111611 RepID=UPI0008F9D533|nr:ACP S-malonyltransferase [Geitlerinema sp. PCC 9228]
MEQNNKIAWVFPGQGSQSVGMEADLLDLPLGKMKFQQAEEILGWSVVDVCQNPDEQVSRTLYTQPSLYVIESILVDLLHHRGNQPQLVAGHSLGEYVALYAAGVFDFATGLQLVKRRAELMDSASGGQMAALMKFDRNQLEEQLAQTPNVVLANDNSPLQAVISGTPEAVDEVVNNVKARRVAKLNVSGAFHSPMMKEAAAEFQKVLDAAQLQDAQIPVLSNVDPSPATDATTLKNRLQQQITGQVRWREISLRLPEEGIEKVIEVGPGNVLTGLIKRTCSELTLENISNAASMH